MNLANLPPLGLKQPPTKTGLRQAAKGQTCTLRLDGCLHSPDTVVLAHLRRFSQAGMGQKPPDWCAVFACAACHDILDRRSYSAPIGDDDILRALIETLGRQFAMGNIEVKE